MATTRLRERKDGSQFYEIRASRKRGDETPPTMRWSVPAGWSKRAIDRELTKVSAEFDRQYKAGEIVSKKERKAKEEAERIALEIENARIKTVNQYGEQIYLPEKSKEVALRTMEYYTTMLERYIYPVIGNYKLREVQETDLKRILNNAHDKGLAHSTQRGIYLTMKQLFDMAFIDHSIASNPMATIKAPKRNKEEIKRNVDSFTLEEISFINKCLEHEPLKWRALFRLIESTGIREGEASALKWDNIDFKSGTVTIDSNAICVSKAVDNNGVVVTTPKSGKERYVYPSAEVLQMLREMKLQTGAYTYVFPQRMKDGKLVDLPMRPQSIEQYLRKFNEKYSITFKCHPHKFRHTFATFAIANGAPITAVSKALGHAQVSTTMNIYAHANDEDVRRASATVQSALNQVEVG